MNNKKPHNIKINKQKGAILVLSIVVLLGLTILGAGTLNSSLTEKKLSQNYLEYQQAINAGNSVALVALNDLESHDCEDYETVVCDSVTCGIYDSISDPISLSDSWWDANGKTVSLTLTGTTITPRYVTRYISSDHTSHYDYYMITTRVATDAAGNNIKFSEKLVSIRHSDNPGCE